MAEARRVGRVHRHEIPNKNDPAVQPLDVYRCDDCAAEYYLKEEKDQRTWVHLNDDPNVAVAYETHDAGEPEIGRWQPAPLNVKDESKSEQTATAPVVTEKPAEEAPAAEAESTEAAPEGE